MSSSLPRSTNNSSTEVSVLESDLVSTPHDRDRREERNISKNAQKMALRYGMKEKGGGKRVYKYYYAGTVLIYNEKTKQALTSYPYATSRNQGTTKAAPILLRKSAEHDNRYAREMQKQFKESLVCHMEHWRSHSVFVLDMSGSMRTDDVNGSRCRSDGVWMAIARDFVMRRLMNQQASVYDVVSVVLMINDTAEVVLRYEPTTWVLYNKLVENSEWLNIKPRGHGYFLPALKLATGLLNANRLSSCSLSLLFLSDGKPSDNPETFDKIYEEMGKIASSFGSRLNLSCIGMAGKSQEFDVLKKMAAEGAAYGSKSTFERPSMSAASLSKTISRLSSSLSTTITEMSVVGPSHGRMVRTDVRRERLDAPQDQRPTEEDWYVFRATTGSSYTVGFWEWNSRRGDFAQVLDRRCLECYEYVVNEGYEEMNGKRCPQCKARFVCNECIRKCTATSSSWYQHTDCSDMNDQRKRGLVAKKKLPSFGVAYKKHAFGEGAERLVFKFRFIDSNGDFVGPNMVAKESRYVEHVEERLGTAEQQNYLQSHRQHYHRRFMRTQATAQRFAELFNKALEKLQRDVPEGSTNLSHLKNYPRISFLSPMIVELVEMTENGEMKERNILVELFLQGKYQKYNTNAGRVMNHDLVLLESDNAGFGKSNINFLLGRKVVGVANSNPAAKAIGGNNRDGLLLGAIAEDEEEASSSEDEGNEDTNDYHSHLDNFIVENADFAEPVHSFAAIPDSAFPQAFSHFSYVRSGGELMIVDLQGTLQENRDGGYKKFVLTDPAIHTRYRRRKNKESSWRSEIMDFGRTDLGMRGIHAFFDSHVCNDACRLFGLRPREKRGMQDH